MNPRTRDRLLSATPYLVFTALTALTWKRWIFPFQDHGREMETPLRLLSGELLYRDVGIAFGPLPPYLDAAALGLLGRSLDVLVAVRIGVALLGIVALGRLLCRFVPHSGAVAAIGGLVVATIFFGYGSAWPFPYSVAALEGTVGTWWAIELALSARGMRQALLAGLVGGLAAGTKLEIAPAAVLAVVLGLLASRPRREVAAGTGVALVLAAAAWGGPIFILGREVLERHGYLIALHNPLPWRRMQREVLLGGTASEGFGAGGILLALLPSALFLGSALLLLETARDGKLLRFGAVFFGALSAAMPRNEELHVLLPLAAVLGVAALWRARPGSRAPWPEPARMAEAAVAAPMLLALWRQPFSLRVPVYAAFAAPLALAFSLAWLARRRRPALLALFFAGLALAQVADRLRDRIAIPMSWVSLPHAGLFLPSECAPAVAAAADTILRLTPSAGHIAVFPEGGLLLFSTRRRSAFVDTQFFPGQQDAEGEQEMVRRLRESPPVLAIQTNQTLRAFGEGEYRQGVLDRFFQAFDARMRPALVLGDPRERIRHLGTATSLVVYLPRRPE